ncbi:PTS sugar transporter subunit IIA [Sporomusa acidovorans]|uniref:PTS system mannose-specific EIIBCA component n=1 Tax=Sporomusa acidovorans (strain ATCC 49682 / DSM 3132 / Mol) TaxID=1123286 RepID=A0ABZ3J1B2_SPOA4|nr:fructose PTS transporter subunit IIA [Sporomusa acidovorans]OZC22788.1 PTS system mannose-specific EIIBCA component [Sporomusa acidovorans DSM 3132]SDE51089.1 PTS system IIA component, Fru family [Sporomusa acidovorans]
MEILTIIKDETVFLELNAASREECLQVMIDGMEKAGFVRDKAAYLAAVNEREQKGSTGIGFGVAIPHGKSSGIVSAGLAFARLANPIDWNSLDGKPVQIVFLIGVSDQDAGNEHMKILIALSRKLIHEDFRKKLLAANSSAELYEVLQSI